MRHRWTKIVFLVIAPIVFFLVIAELWSWRPRMIQRHRRSVVVAFSPDGETLASGSWDGKVRIWNRKSLSLKREISLDDRLESIGFSSDGKNIFAGTSADMIHVAEASTGKILWMFGHPGWQTKIAFSPDGKCLADASGKVWLWDGHSNTFDYVKKVNKAVERTAFSADGKLLLGVTNNGKVYFWDTEKFHLKREVHLSLTNTPSSFALSPDGSLIATSYGTDSVIKLWDVSTSDLLREISSAPSQTSSLVFSPDGHTLVAGNRDGTITIWRIK